MQFSLNVYIPMKKLTKLISANTERFILFTSGVVLSALVSELLQETVSWSVAALIFMTVLLTIVAIYLLSVSHSRLNNLVEKTGITAEYVTEPYQQEEYSGSVYKRLLNLVEQAEREILYLSTGGGMPITDEGIQKTGLAGVYEHEARKSFLKAIEEKVFQQKDKGFKYILIRQVNNSKIAYSKALVEHCQRILEIKHTFAPIHDASIDLLKIPPQRMNSFLIIDQRYLVIFLYSDLKDAAFTSGILLLEDRAGKMVRKLSWYFDNLERIAQPVQSYELVDREVVASE